MYMVFDEDNMPIFNLYIWKCLPKKYTVYQVYGAYKLDFLAAYQ